MGGAHFEAALRTVRPRTDAATLRFYENYELYTHGGSASKAGAPLPAAANSDRTPFAFGPLAPLDAAAAPLPEMGRPPVISEQATGK